LRYSHSKKTASEILEDIFAPTHKKFIVADHCALMGILVGYGRNNAIAFANRSYVQQLGGLRLSDYHYILDVVLDAGCVTIQSGTNEQEN